MQNKKVTPLKIFILYLILETLAVVFAAIYSRNRIEDAIGLFIDFQIMLILFSAVFFWIYHHRNIYFISDKKMSRIGQVKLVVAAMAIIIIGALWDTYAYPACIKKILASYGQASTAYVQEYGFLKYMGKGGDRWVNNVNEAETISAKLSYSGYVYTISAEKGTPSFNQIYEAAQNGESIRVRYLKIEPAIVRPEIEFK